MFQFEFLTKRDWLLLAAFLVLGTSIILFGVRWMVEVIT
jgi:hypothetical protein